MPLIEAIDGKDGKAAARPEPLVAAGRVEVRVEPPRPLGNGAVSRRGRTCYRTPPFAPSRRFADAFVFERVGARRGPTPTPPRGATSRSSPA
jgi:hypothetical protein